MNFLKYILFSDKTRPIRISLFILFLSGIVLGVYLNIEQPELTLIDICYYLVTTAVTVGYGDISPKTPIGKILAIVFMIFGIVSMAFLFSAFTERIQRSAEKIKKGIIKMNTTIDLLIVGFPSEEKIRDLVSQLRSDEKFENAKIVLISDSISEKPEFFTEQKILFKKGIASERKILEDIGINNVKTALVLAEKPLDIKSDDMSSSALVAIETLCPSIRTIVEKVRKDDLLFIASKADVITKVANANLLAQEILEEGAIEFESFIFNNETVGTQNNIFVKEDIKWKELAINLILEDKIPEGFKNPGEKSFNFFPKKEDLIKQGAIVKIRS